MTPLRAFCYVASFSFVPLLGPWWDFYVLLASAPGVVGWLQPPRLKMFAVFVNFFCGKSRI